MTEVERLEKEIDALKEYASWTSNLLMKYSKMRNKVLSKEYKGDYEKVRSEGMYKFPIIQGLQNRIDITSIGNLRLKPDQDKMRLAVNVLLDRSPSESNL